MNEINSPIIELGIDIPIELGGSGNTVTMKFKKDDLIQEGIKMVLDQKFANKDKGKLEDYYMYGSLNTNEGQKIVIFKSDKCFKEYFLKPMVYLSFF